MICDGPPALDDGAAVTASTPPSPPRHPVMSAAQVLTWIATRSTKHLEYASRYPGQTVTWIETRDPTVDASSALSITDAMREFETALVEGRIQCQGVHKGQSVGVPPAQWTHLVLLYGRNSAGMPNGGVQIEDLAFVTSAVLREWPDTPCVGETVPSVDVEPAVAPSNAMANEYHPYPCEPPEILTGEFVLQDWPRRIAMRRMMLKAVGRLSMSRAAYIVAKRDKPPPGRGGGADTAAGTASIAKRLTRNFNDINWELWDSATTEQIPNGTG